MDSEDPGSRRRVLKGRGAVSNLPGRYERRPVVPFDDGWSDADPPVDRLPTIATPERSRTIIATNDSPDIPFNRSINPYKGCEHGCIYCFARPTHAYLDLSPGLDFETRIFTKPDAPALLRKALCKPGYRCEVMALGTNTDPYQPLERRLRITRGVLETLREFHHPLSVVTKSTLVLRDLDILAPMARDGLVTVYLSVTTLDRALARRMEPRAATPGRRLQTIAALEEAGVPTGVLASPMIPGINDHELERILEAAAASGARTANYILVRLPHEVRELFEQWLETHYPARAAKVLGQIREMRGGRLNDPRFGSRMRGRGPRAELLRRRFEIAARRHGLVRDPPALDCSRFRVPPSARPQGRLFS